MASSRRSQASASRIQARSLVGSFRTRRRNNLLAGRFLADPLAPSVAAKPPSPSSGGGRNAAPSYPFPNQRIVNRTVLKRPGEPQDVANAIAFLCSDLAAYVTGIELNVSGGVELFVF